MKLISIQLQNYKSIQDSKELFMDSKLNVLAGKNNAGKTALLQALSIFFREKQLIEFHKVVKEESLNVQQGGVLQSNTSTLTLKFSLNHVEAQMLIGQPEDIVCNNFKMIVKANKYSIGIQEVLDDIAEGNIFSIRSENESNKHHMYNCGQSTNFLGVSDKLRQIFDYIKNSLIYIQSTRVLPVEDHTNINKILDDNGANMHSHFFTLHNNSEHIFDHIEKVFKTIFTDVQSLKTIVVGNGKTSIHIKFEGESESFPLHECGSGYTHVLIMLCILYTIKDKIILYDEPHLYLHPSAEKAIYDLVDFNDNLQFIFTTHSPILINYPTPKNLFLVKKVKGYSEYSLMTDIQDILKDIGIQNGDFALADKVLFVEGETEEKIIPEILSAFDMKQIGYNYKILNMKGTGNAFSKSSAMSNNAQKLTQIFDGLGSSPIPYCILVDRDERSKEQISKLEVNYKENIVILHKREIENYFLLKPSAISVYLKRLTSNSSITDEMINTFIDSCYNNTGDRKLFPKSQTCPENDIVGSEVLERLFSQYESHYNKVDDGYALTIEILRSEPEVLQPIAEQLRNFIELK